MKSAIKWFVPLVGVAVIMATAGGSMADICSGKIKQIIACTTARACDIATNPSCKEAIVLRDPLAEDCNTNGAVEADNCINSTTTRICADKFACEYNVAHTACVQGAPGATVTDHVPSVGGDCELELVME